MINLGNTLSDKWLYTGILLFRDKFNNGARDKPAMHITAMFGALAEMRREMPITSCAASSISSLQPTNLPVSGSGLGSRRNVNLYLYTICQHTALCSMLCAPWTYVCMEILAKN